jgi:hypothetical protein
MPSRKEKWPVKRSVRYIFCRTAFLHYKVNGAGERTDLVFQDLGGKLVEEQRYVDGFVLIEWKTVPSEKEAEKPFREARTQAERYAQGAFGGSE